jgi:hypothetical protein
MKYKVNSKTDIKKTAPTLLKYNYLGQNICRFSDVALHWDRKALSISNEVDSNVRAGML